MTGQLEAFPEVVGVADIDTDERYTLEHVKAQCNAAAGVKAWDLDVAACLEAHVAPKYLTKADNGLLHAWWGRVWCNPPWSNIGPWVKKAWSEWDRPRRVVKVIGVLLPSTRTDLEWWHEHVEPHRDRPGSPLHTRFLPTRLKYGKPGDLQAKKQGQPEFGSVFLWWKR